MILPRSGIVWSGTILAVAAAAWLWWSTGNSCAHSHPDPARDYAEAIERARRVIVADDRVVAAGGASILRTHDQRRPRAMVLLHGLTDSPRQFAWLAESLYVHGDNVYVPRLPHHAKRQAGMRELARLSAEDLCRSGDEAIDIASGLGDTIVVVGLSAGGTVAAWVAEHREDVRRAVMIAPAFAVTHVPLALEQPLVALATRLPNITIRATMDSARPDRHPGVATRAVAQVLRLGLAVRRDAEQPLPGRTEMLFLVSATDHTVNIPSILEVARVWNQRGAVAMVYEFPATLALPHNVVDPIEHPHDPVLVAAVVEALARGEPPPAFVQLTR